MYATVTLVDGLVFLKLVNKVSQQNLKSFLIMRKIIAFKMVHGMIV